MIKICVHCQERCLTIRLNSCSSLHQVIGQLHGVSWAQGQITRETDHQDAHQSVLQQRNLRAQPEKETNKQEIYFSIYEKDRTNNQSFCTMFNQRRYLTFCHSQVASCPICNRSQAAL